MILLPDAQRTPAWVAARLGLPTASKFDRLLSDGTKRSRDKVERFARDLLTEWLLGIPSDAATSAFMNRGTNLEPMGRATYAFDRGVEVREVGLCLRDDRRCGASVDGFIDDDGVLEIKIPSAVVHIEYLLDPVCFYAAYETQCQGILYVTERMWLDLYAFNPVFPPAVWRVERDDAFIARLATAVDDFCIQLEAMKAKLIALGVRPLAPVDFQTRKAALDAEAAEFDALVREGLPSARNATLLDEIRKQREARAAD